VKIAPGVRLNVNKRSVGVSFGPRGARYSINSDGRRTRSVGIPGTGISYRDQAGPTRRRVARVSSGDRLSSPTRLIAHAVGVSCVVIFIFGILESHPHFAGTVVGIGIVVYIALRLLRPILDPLILWLLTRDTPAGSDV
jgi:hypothetical protein